MHAMCGISQQSRLLLEACPWGGILGRWNLPFLSFSALDSMFGLVTAGT